MANIDFAEYDSGNINENIDTKGRISELRHSVVIKETFLGDVGLRAKIFIDHFDEFFGVFGRFFDKEIDVSGVSWVAMRNYCVAADNDKLNAMELQ